MKNFCFLLSVLLLACLFQVSAMAQCATINSSTLTLSSKTGTAPNQTCTYTITPNVTISGNATKLVTMTFTSGSTTRYVCYTSSNGTTVSVLTQNTPCNNANKQLPTGTSTFPTATFTLPCGAGSNNVYSGYNGSGNQGPTGECNPAGPQPIPMSGPTPVSLSAFEGTRTTEGILLTWATVDEVQNNYFEVQHSTNATDFNSVATIQGNGSSVEKHTYQFLHRGATEGNNYYRLKQVDFDGTVHFSTMVAVAKEETKQALTVYPNPIQNNVLFVKDIRAANLTAAFLTDMDGKQISLKRLVQPDGVQLSLENSLKTGVYLLHLVMPEGNVTKKILID